MFSFRKASERNTQAYEVVMWPHHFFLSYETVIGYSGPLGNCRLPNDWGPTTGRHIREMGLKDFPEVGSDQLEDR